MLVQLSVRRCTTVASYEDASAAVRKFIGNRGASQCPRGMGLISEGGAIVAHVSYNGRVWAGKEWVSGATPLYDPCKTSR